MTKTAPVWLTTQQVCAGFGISRMCLHNWLAGSTQRTPLPSKREGKHRTAPHLYSLTKMVQWADKHGVTFSPRDAQKVRPVHPKNAKPVLVKKQGTA